MMTLRAMSTLQTHLDALRAILARMEPDHIARDTIKGRIREAEEALSRG